jgi:DNA topoisomerase III
MSSDFGPMHRNWTSCDPLALFEAPVETNVAEDKKSIERNLISEARKSQMLMIWTDCDREGENIGMEVAKVCRKANNNIQVKRAKFSAIIAQYVSPQNQYLFFTVH